MCSLDRTCLPLLSKNQLSMLIQLLSVLRCCLYLQTEERCILTHSALQNVTTRQRLSHCVVVRHEDDKSRASNPGKTKCFQRFSSSCCCSFLFLKSSDHFGVWCLQFEVSLQACDDISFRFFWLLHRRNTICSSKKFPG